MKLRAESGAKGVPAGEHLFHSLEKLEEFTKAVKIWLDGSKPRSELNRAAATMFRLQKYYVGTAPVVAYRAYVLDGKHAKALRAGKAFNLHPRLFTSWSLSLREAEGVAIEKRDVGQSVVVVKAVQGRSGYFDLEKWFKDYEKMLYEYSREVFHLKMHKESDPNRNLPPTYDTAGEQEIIVRGNGIAKLTMRNVVKIRY